MSDAATASKTRPEPSRGDAPLEALPSAVRTACRGALLDEVGWGGARIEQIPGDASFRSYQRLSRTRLDGTEESAILMDAPPPREDIRPFTSIARRLTGFGYSAPRILAENDAAGFLLLEDLGDATFTRVLAGDPTGDLGAEERLYALATDLLIDLHRRPAAETTSGLAPYDEAVLLREARLLTDWTLPVFAGAPLPDGILAGYEEAWRAVFPVLAEVPETLVLRDYHVDNLMDLKTRDGIARCGLLDFQDALAGSIAYDVVSLLEDARRDVPPALAAAMKARYLAAFPDLDRAAFEAAYAVLGVQRSAKIVGIFTRLLLRDGKPVYLKHIPRLWRWIEAGLEHPALAPVRSWFDRQVPICWRIIPPVELPK